MSSIFDTEDTENFRLESEEGGTGKRREFDVKNGSRIFREGPWASMLLLAAAGAVIVLATCSRDFSRQVAGGANSITVDSITPASGPNSAETAITIKGTNFSGKFQVFVGSAECTGVSQISRNILTAVVPSGIEAGIYDVTITSKEGGSAIDPQGFTVVDPTLISITSIMPDKGVNDVQTAVVISGENFVAPLTVTVGETPLVAIDVADTQTVNAVVPAGIDAGHYDVIVTNPDGTAATLTEGFEVIDASAIRIDSVDPTSGSMLEDVEVTIVGANFVDPVKVYLGATELADPAPVFQSDSRVVATVPAGMTAGLYDMKIENPDSESYTLEDAYTVTEGDDDTTDDDTSVDDDTADDDTSADDTEDDDVW
jgi:hypothetical protein